MAQIGYTWSLIDDISNLIQGEVAMGAFRGKKVELDLPLVVL